MWSRDDHANIRCSGEGSRGRSLRLFRRYSFFRVCVDCVCVCVCVFSCLYLDVMSAFDELLQQHPSVAETAYCFRGRPFESASQLAGVWKTKASRAYDCDNAQLLETKGSAMADV